MFVCPSVTDFSDFCGYSSHRLHPLFPLLSFQLGFSGIPENDEKTSISPSNERYTWTPFWDPFLSLFSEKVPFFPRRVRPLFASLRRNPARRVYLVFVELAHPAGVGLRSTLKLRRCHGNSVPASVFLGFQDYFTVDRKATPVCLKRLPIP